MNQASLLPAPTDSVLFDHWQRARSQQVFLPLSEESARPYGYIWRSWCDWLNDDRGLLDPHGYLSADADELTRFLRHGPSPVSTRKGLSAEISPITRLRYAWLLRELYQFACVLGHLERNPMSSVSAGPSPTAMEMAGQILPPSVVPTLYRRLVATTPSQRAVYDWRDRALLLVLLATGMTSAELRNMTVDDLARNRPHAGSYTLNIPGTRDAQARSLVIKGDVAQALKQWMVESEYVRRSAKWVFLSQRHCQLTTAGLYRIVANAVTETCKDVGILVPSHIGPGVVRNTILVHVMRQGSPQWSDEQLCAHFGLKSVSHLLRSLGIHLNDGLPLQ